MRLVFISDSHGQHPDLNLPAGDVLVHAGDLTGRGRKWEITDFLRWFGAQPHPHKVMIAGNHDFLAEREPELFQSLVPDNVHYLENSAVEIEGLKFWGSPITPWFFDWAFNRQRGEDIARYWREIPDDTDILITHGPPAGILDQTSRGERVGCEDLLVRIRQVKPRIHVFGHIHEAYGQHHEGGTHFINASVLNLRYWLTNAPIVVDL